MCQTLPSTANKCKIPFLRLNTKNKMAIELEKLAVTNNHTNVLQPTKFKMKYNKMGYGNYKKEPKPTDEGF